MRHYPGAGRAPVFMGERQVKQRLRSQHDEASRRHPRAHLEKALKALLELALLPGEEGQELLLVVQGRLLLSSALAVQIGVLANR